MVMTIVRVIMVVVMAIVVTIMRVIVIIMSVVVAMPLQLLRRSIPVALGALTTFVRH
ncbi:hypothetical protein [Halotalea alkalilenta]|uniref:hypothetical protein n=1 Tax=Halotalea alkalilenta TaxID=376489 RepID=UPI001CBE26D7|nr:hypothetical protein [Halotalea alkalilenta]